MAHILEDTMVVSPSAGRYTDIDEWNSDEISPSPRKTECTNRKTSSGEGTLPGQQDAPLRGHCPFSTRQHSAFRDIWRVDGGRERPEGSRPVTGPERPFSDFLEAAPDAVVIADRDGRIIRINAQAEKLYGYTRAELLGREVEVLIPERFRERHVEQRTAYSAAPGQRPMGSGQPLYGLRKDGREFPAEISLSPLATADGFVVASAIRDITERRRLEEELRKRSRELEDAARHKDEFLGMLAHELRNPLGTIRNAVHVLKLLDSPDRKLQCARDIIGRQAEHMTHLIEDLLDGSRIAHGKIGIRKESVDLGVIVGQAIETCRPLLSARKQDLTVSLPAEAVRLMADPTRLAQVLINLLNNAAKYTDEGGRIWLTAEAEPDEIVVRIRDDGVGIEAAMLPRIFELFTQVPDALERSEGGLGIGLAMVGHLIQSHGGVVQAFSEGVGRGSEFVFRLPRQAAAENASCRETDRTSAKAPGGFGRSAEGGGRW